MLRPKTIFDPSYWSQKAKCRWIFTRERVWLRTVINHNINSDSKKIKVRQISSLSQTDINGELHFTFLQWEKLFFLNEVRKRCFILFSQVTKGYISVFPLFFLNWLYRFALPSYDTRLLPSLTQSLQFLIIILLGEFVPELARISHISHFFQSCFGPGTWQKTCLPIYAFKTKSTDLSLGLKCETALGLPSSSSQPHPRPALPTPFVERESGDNSQS